uniref:DHC_N1 domain-containing protein n=1 Tax=Globodera pallida TaxID=36090 RepID=A0A183CLH3_GLOPA
MFAWLSVFNRKLGVGIFRGDIEPKSKNAENVDGIVFQLLLLVTLGRKSAMLMRKFDEIFLHALRLTFDLPPPIACHVNGIFLRCEMNPGKGLEKEQNPYGNLMDLPIMAKLEIWIGDRSHKEPVLTTLISELRARIDKLEIPSNTFRPFIAINRVQHWTKEAQKW